MKVSMFYCEGKSDKVYHVQLDKVLEGYVVNFQYGRRGSALNSGTKTESPVSLENAQKVFTKLVNEKQAKGYKQGADSVLVIPQGNFVKTEVVSEILPQLLNPIEDPEIYINDDNFLAQEKIDGERRIVCFDGEITQYNRKGQLIPTITDLKSAIKDTCVLDGEIVGEEFFVFDLLSFKGKDIRNLKCEERITLLSTLSFGKGITRVLTATSLLRKKKLFEHLQMNNKEGIVFKRKDAQYVVGRPASGGDNLKFKFYKTATFLVSNLTEGKRSVGLELIDGSERIFMGKVTIPPNHKVPTVGTLVEVRYLYAYRGGAVFQPTYLGPRTDVDMKEVTLKQIVYKSEEI